MVINNSANYQYGYPYAGHYDDPYNPTIDINFGQTQYLYLLLDYMDHHNDQHMDNHIGRLRYMRRNLGVINWHF